MTLAIAFTASSAWVSAPEVVRAASPEEQLVASGIEQFLGALTGLDGLDELGDAIPFTELLPTGPGGLDVPAVFDQLRALVNILPTKTASAVENALNGLDGTVTGGVTLSIDTDVTDSGITFNKLALTRTLDTTLAFLSGDPLATDTFSLDGGTLSVDLGLTVADSAGNGALHLHLHEGQLTIPSSTPPPAARFTASASLNGASVATRLGILDVTAAGTVASSVNLDIRWLDPDASGRITAFELVNSAPADLFDISLSSTTPSSATMNLALTAGLTGLGGVTGTISLNDTNLADGLDTPTVSLGGLGDFTNMSPQDVLAAIAQLAISMRSMQVILGNPSLPFIDENLAELGNWSDKITKLFTENGLSSPENPIDLAIEDLEAKGLVTIEGIIAKLEASLGVAAGALGLTYHPADSTVTFTVEVLDEAFFQQTPSAAFNVADELARAGITGLQLDGGASISISPSYSLDLTVGLDLSDLKADPAAFPITERVFIQPGDGPELSFSAPVDANIALSGTIGMLQLKLDDGQATPVPVLRTRSGGTGPMVAVNLSGGGADGRITVAEVFDSLATLGATAAGNTFTIAGPNFSIAASLDLAVPPITLDATASIGSTDLAGATVTFAWPDLTVGEPLVTTGGTFNDDFLSFALDPSDPLALFATILQGIDAALQIFEDLSGNEVDRKLPIVGTSLSDLMSFVDAVQDAINALSSDPAATLDLLELTVESAIIAALDGLDGTIDFPNAPTIPSPGDPKYGTGDNFDLALFRADVEGYLAALETYVAGFGNFVTLDYVPGNSPGALMFKLDVGVCSDKAAHPGCSFEYPLEKSFNLNLAEVVGADFGGIIAAEGSGDLSLDYGVVASVHLGVELPEVTPAGPGQLVPSVSGLPKVFLADTSGITASVEGSIVAEFGASIGPFGVQVGSAAALPETGTDCANDTDDDGDGVVNDGCPKVGDDPETGDDCLNDTDDDGDGAVNDGCPAVGNPVVAKAGAAFSLSNTVTGGRAYLNPGPGQPALGTFFSGITPNITKVPGLTCVPGGADVIGCAHLPVYFDGPTDLIFLGNLDFTLSEFDPSSATLTGDDVILANLKGAAEAFVWQLIGQGIKEFGTAVDDAVSAAAYDVQIPVVGDLLDAGANVSGAFKTKITDPVGDLVTTLGASNTFAAMKSGVQDFFWNSLNGASADPATRFILNYDDPAAAPVKDEDVVVTLVCTAAKVACDDDDHGLLDLQDLQVQLAIGQVAAATTPAFDWGVPGIRLKGDATLSATVSWQVNLGFGVSLDDGFYLMSSTLMSEANATPTRPKGNDISIIADVDFGVETADLSQPPALTGDLAFLSAAVWNTKAAPSPEVRIELGVDIPDPAPGDNRIGLGEMLGALDVTTWDVNIGGGVDLKVTLATTAAVEGGAEEGTIPRLLADLHLIWGFSGNLDDGLSVGDLDAGFSNIRLDLGSFIAEFLSPVLAEVQKYTKPLQPIIDTIQAPIPGVSQLAELVGADPIALIDLMEAVSGADLTLIRRLLDVISFANAIPTVTAGTPSLIIPLGSFSLDGFALTKPELPSNVKDKLIEAGSQTIDAGVSGAGGVLGALNTKAQAGEFGGKSQEFGTQLAKSRTGGGFSFPAFEEPTLLFQLLVGKDIELVEFDAGVLRASVGWSQSFGPITLGPVPVSVVVSISAAVEGRFVIGYDTKGIRQLVKNLTDDSTDNDGFFDSVGLLFAGVYLSDLDKNGVDVPEIRLTLEGAVGAAVDLVIVKAGIEAGLRATLDLNLRDGGFLEPVPAENLDGKLRIDEIITYINNPLCLFDVSGRLEAFIRLFVTIDFFLFSTTFKQTIVNIVLLELDNITAELCTPPPPVLAQPAVAGSDVLRLNMGPFAGPRKYAVDEKDEKFTVRQVTEAVDGKATVTVTAFGIVQTFTGISKVIGDGGDGKDTIIAESGSISGVCQADGTIAPPVPGMSCDGATEEGKTVTKAITFTIPVSFCGGPGADKLGGGMGDDLLVGHGNLPSGALGCNVGGANDGPDDSDAINGQGGNDTIHGNGGDDILNGDAGDDTIHGGGGNDEMIGGPGRDTMYGGDGADNMLGGPEEDPCPGDDRDLCSNAADDIMYGGPGDDTMEGDHGKDQMFGDAGNDTIVGGKGDDTINGGADNDNLFGNEGNDTINGDSGDDDIFGGTGDDTINGGAGDDDLIGEEGHDTVNGGAGMDIILGDRGIINRSPGVGGFVADPGKLLVELIATPPALAGNDILNGGDDADRMWGQEGNDTMSGGAGDDVMRGNAGDDTMSGNAGADEMFGDAGNDVMFGDALVANGALDGVDTIRGGDGDDIISGNAKGDRLFGDAGDDIIFGDADNEVCADDGDDFILGGPGDDLLFGNSGADIIFGEGGDDRIVGGSNTAGVCDGIDQISGGPGNDVIAGDNATIADGASANDKLVTLLLDDQGAGDIIAGDAGDDRIYGQFGDDTISGGIGNDVIEGNEGNDVIDGGVGADDLVGGSSSNDGVIDADRVGTGRPDGVDIISGGGGIDYIAGDNALISRQFPAAGRAVVELFDVSTTTSTPTAGTSAGDTISGGDGNDLIFGQGGADTIDGDAGDDYIEGNDGDDTIRGGDGDDDLVGGGSANDGVFDADRVGTGLTDVGEALISGGAGEDWIAGDNALVNRKASVPAAPGRAPIELFDVATVANPTAGAGTGGSDTISGGDGPDWIFGQTGNDVIDGDAGNDYIEGNDGDDTIRGGDGDDDLVGGGSANDGVIDGDRVGNGLIDGGETLISGGAGVDWITGDNALVNRNRPVPPTFGRAPIELFDVQRAGGPAISPLVSGGDVLHGDEGDDRIFGQGNGVQPLSQTDPEDGRNNDFVGAPQGSPDFHRITGLADEDAATWLGDVILGGLGDDEIEGGHGNDLIFGNGTGVLGQDEDDIVGGGSADDGKIWNDARLNFGANLLDGHDTIHGDSADDTVGDDDVILGDNGWIIRLATKQVGPGPGEPVDQFDREVRMVQTLTPAGTYGNDYIAGNGGHDELYGQAGHDAMLGGWGSDAMVGDLGKVTTQLLGPTGGSLCGAPRLHEPKQPFVGELVCQPGTLFRQVELYAYDDTKAGAVIGDDVMLGGDGDDWMHGGAGVDLMQGDGDGGEEIVDPVLGYTTIIVDPNPATADRDRIFGGDSNGRGTVDPVTGGNGDAIWGGRGDDHLYGGNGADMIDVRPDAQYPATWSAWAGADVESYHGVDVAYGGFDQDAMQANVAANGPVAGDRMLDWAGVYNITYLCPATYGAYVTVRGQPPDLIDWVIVLAATDGAVDPGNPASSGGNEVAMVYKKDVKANTNPIYPGTPGHFTCSP
jgi:Ca2+-binding RTX toxin-like protein